MILRDNFRFEPDTLSAAPGADLELLLINQGQLPHTFTLFAERNPSVPFDDPDALQQYYETHPTIVDIVLAEGEERTVSFPAPTEEGTYVFVCMRRGHAAEGMTGVLRVESPVGPPSAPQDLEAVVGDGTVDLSWRPPVDDGGAPIEGYRVYRGTDPANLVLLAEVDTGLAYTDRAVADGVTYHYAVSAVNEAGEGPRAGPVEVATPEPLPRGGVVPGGAAVVVFALLALGTRLLGRRRGGPRSNGPRAVNILLVVGAIVALGFLLESLLLAVVAQVLVAFLGSFLAPGAPGPGGGEAP